MKDDEYDNLSIAAREYVARNNNMSYGDITQLPADGKVQGIEVYKIKREVSQKITENIAWKRAESFWYRLSTTKLIGMVMLCGLVGVVAGYVGTWIVLWAIYVFIHWLALGFREDEPANKQKQ